MSDTTTRVRYGRTDVTRVINSTPSVPSHTVTERVPKNTLFTIKNGDFVHFGVARCNNELDRFSKNIGKLIASNRANLAVDESNILTKDCDFVIHPSNLRGTVRLNNITKLLQYFRNIDTAMCPTWGENGAS